MNDGNQFEKPLKGYQPDPARNRKIGAYVSVFLVLVFGLPLFHFYDGWALFSPEPNTKQATETAALKTAKTPDAQTKDEDGQRGELAQRDPDRQHVLDPEGGNLQVVESEDGLTQLTPVTTPAPQSTTRKVRRQEQSLAHLPDPELVERGATGVIPKKSPDGLRAMDVYSRQPDTEGNFGVARVVLVIGGLGISQTSTKQAIDELPGSVTLAFAPYGNSLSRWMQDARKAGHELLLQVPMEPLDYPQNDPGPHTLKATEDLEANLANLHWSMSRITNYVGITNYLGNKMLQEPAGLSPIFAEIANRGLLFFEDGTVKNSLAQGVALKELLPYAKADVLLDNVRSRSAIINKLNQLSEQAKRTGIAIGMGNAFPETITLVGEYVRQAKRNGIEITPVSAVAKDPAE